MATNERGNVAKTLTKDLIVTKVRSRSDRCSVLTRISKLRLGNLQTKFQFENGSTSERLPKH